MYSMQPAHGFLSTDGLALQIHMYNTENGTFNKFLKRERQNKKEVTEATRYSSRQEDIQKFHEN